MRISHTSVVNIYHCRISISRNHIACFVSQFWHHIKILTWSHLSETLLSKPLSPTSLSPLHILAIPLYPLPVVASPFALCHYGQSTSSYTNLLDNVIHHTTHPQRSIFHVCIQRFYWQMLHKQSLNNHTMSICKPLLTDCLHSLNQNS